jgi:hypothetical protein
MKLIGKVGDFELFERTKDGFSEWRDFKLVRSGTGKFPKRNWWLAWNGDRLARGRDAVLLEEHYPEIHAAVIEAIR